MKELTPQALDRAFSRTPACISDSINEAFENGERKMKFRSKLLSLSGVAAALVMIVTVAAFAAGGLEAGKPRPDNVTQPQILATSATIEPSPSEAPAELYYYTPNGRYIHSVSDCSGMVGAQAHSLTEAYASGKGFCPVCVPTHITPEPMLSAAPTLVITAMPTQMPEVTAEPTPVITAMPTPIPDEVIENEEVFYDLSDDDNFAIVYIGWDDDPYYHSSLNCTDAESLPNLRSRAEAIGLKPCPICLPQETTEPAPTAQDAVGAFELIFGVPFGEVFPKHEFIENVSYAANEQEAGSSLNVFSDGNSEISLDMYAGDEYRLHLDLPDSAASNALMLLADEQISSLYREAAPGYIEGIAAVAALEENLSYRLQSLQIAYAPDGNLNQCKLIYRLSDDTNVLLCWSMADKPTLTGFIWSND